MLNGLGTWLKSRLGQRAPRDVAYDADRKTTVFISYSRKDSAFVVSLAALLEKSGYRTIYDQSSRQSDDPDHHLTAQDEWWRALQMMIAASDVVVFLVSPHSAASKICDDEIAHSRRLGKRIVPALVAPIDFNAAPERLRALNVGLDFSSAHAFDDVRTQQALMRELDRDIEWIRRGAHFARLAQKWTHSGRPTDQLLRAGAIKEADEWISHRPRDAENTGPALLEFLAESRRRERRDRLVLACIAIVACVAGMAAIWFGIDAFNQSRSLESRNAELERTQSDLTDTERQALEQRTRAEASLIGTIPNLVRRGLEDNKAEGALALVLAGRYLAAEPGDGSSWEELFQLAINDRGAPVGFVGVAPERVEIADSGLLLVSTGSSATLYRPGDTQLLGQFRCPRGENLSDVALSLRGEAAAFLCGSTIWWHSISASGLVGVPRRGPDVGEVQDIAFASATNIVAFDRNAALSRTYRLPDGELLREYALRPGIFGPNPDPYEDEDFRPRFDQSERNGFVVSNFGEVFDILTSRRIARFDVVPMYGCGQDVCRAYIEIAASRRLIVAGVASGSGLWSEQARSRTFARASYASISALTAAGESATGAGDRLWRRSMNARLNATWFSPNARMVAVAMGGGVAVFDLGSDRLTPVPIPTGSRRAVWAQTHTGHIAMLDTAGELLIYDYNSRARFAQFQLRPAPEASLSRQQDFTVVMTSEQVALSGQSARWISESSTFESAARRRVLGLLREDSSEQPLGRLQFVRLTSTNQELCLTAGFSGLDERYDSAFLFRVSQLQVAPSAQQIAAAIQNSDGCNFESARPQIIDFAGNYATAFELQVDDQGVVYVATAQEQPRGTRRILELSGTFRGARVLHNAATDGVFLTTASELFVAPGVRIDLNAFIQRECVMLFGGPDGGLSSIPERTVQELVQRRLTSTNQINLCAALAATQASQEGASAR